MPRYAYQKPRAKVYAYNYGYMNNYYKPMTHYLSKESHLPSERPGAQSLAEQGRRRPVFDPIWFRHPWSWECIWIPPHESTVTPHFGVESCYNLITKFLRLKPLSELTYS